MQYFKVAAGEKQFPSNSPHLTQLLQSQEILEQLLSDDDDDDEDD
jgi:hypothetical protein